MSASPVVHPDRCKYTTLSTSHKSPSSPPSQKNTEVDPTIKHKIIIQLCITELSLNHNINKYHLKYACLKFPIIMTHPSPAIHIFSSASNHWIRWTWSLLHLAFWPRHRANLWTSHEGRRNPRDPTLWSQIFRSFVWKIRCRNKKHPKWKTVVVHIGEVDEEWWIHEFFWLNFLFHCLWGHNTLYLEEVWSFDWWKSNPPHRQCGGMIGTDGIGSISTTTWPP